MADSSPIIFSAPMILALKASRKTMTRRLAWRFDKPTRWQRTKPGDQLWVREGLTARNMDLLGHLGLTPPLRDLDTTRADIAVAYAADRVFALEEKGFNFDWIWQRYTLSAIYMPRHMSRFRLTVTATRIEPVQAITEDDAIAEGCCRYPFTESSRRDFRDTWDRLHGKRSWEANLEVVAISFSVERVGKSWG